MTASLSNKARAEPNLTPMLDMVFQLITFFMLVINFKSNMMDKQMELPVVGTARPRDKNDNHPFLMVNLNRNGDFTVLGRKIPDDKIPDYIATQANSDRKLARRKNPNFGDNDELETTVIIRADKATPFSKVYKVVKACRDEGYRLFAFRAMNKVVAKET
jgi:biopolymer transport protein ExbD